ncbi:MAG TPA: bifunctional 4-hydroxy-2-oxoglutarate aldolase/2-dehydro-3-deoxy-phosphogluconate aldolase [Acidimicrobiia bacterium]|nr:bifunctional 4-hydroxy-2-oxoglutarate aldolase/2-dehydro-3-deoxy-phosphogluconate aldolase [Acidimicrobiia bacterium]
MRNLIDRLRQARVVAILRLDDVDERGVDLALRLHAQGVRAVECTLDKPNALVAIQRLRREIGSDTLIGAGTVTRLGQIDELAEVGVDFCVTPHLDPELVSRSLEVGVPILPGVMTPTELAAAHRLGVPAVKLFPAGSLGVDYLKALRGPFGDFPVVPTGGIEVGDVRGWLDAGALCVGLGSALTRHATLPSELSGLLGDSAA